MDVIEKFAESAFLF